MTLSERIARVNGAVCTVTYPHHSHLVVRDNMRSISDAPLCEGIPAERPILSPFTRAALAGTLPAKVLR